jgi:hypothetical protein
VIGGLLGAQGTPKTAAIAGTVRDTLGHPLRMVAVTVDSSEITAVTDDSGRFHLGGIAAGKNGFSLRRIGFSPVEFETTLEAERTLVIEIRMKSLQTLNTVTVTETGPIGLHRAGFYERKNVGLGTFLPPEKIDSLSNLPQASMMIATTLARGVRRSCPRRSGNVCDLTLPVGCRWLFVDGHQVEGVFDEVVSPSEIAAVEIYDRAAYVPAEFQGRLQMRSAGRGMLTTNTGCGAIAVWTKNRVASTSAVPRRP